MGKTVKELTEWHIENVCKIGQGKLTCRYLLEGGVCASHVCGKDDRYLRTMVDYQKEHLEAKEENCPGLRFDAYY